MYIFCSFVSFLPLNGFFDSTCPVYALSIASNDISGAWLDIWFCGLTCDCNAKVRREGSCEISSSFEYRLPPCCLEITAKEERREDSEKRVKIDDERSFLILPFFLLLLYRSRGKKEGGGTLLESTKRELLTFAFQVRFGVPLSYSFFFFTRFVPFSLFFFFLLSPSINRRAPCSRYHDRGDARALRFASYRWSTRLETIRTLNDYREYKFARNTLLEKRKIL